MRDLIDRLPPAFVVLAPGLSTTIQDRGRHGWQRIGIPVSGALDSVALAAANVVVGNPPGCEAVECLYTGCAMALDAERARIAIAGEGAFLEITGEHERAPHRIPSLQSITVSRGARITVHLPGPSLSAYLAIEGGIDVPQVMGSRSTYVRAGIGGLEGRRLRTGDRLALGIARPETRADMRLQGMSLAPRSTVRVVLGPQHDHFTPEAIATLTTAIYTVAPLSDRMGLRLNGRPLAHLASADIVSDGIPPGAIQVPGNGQPIVMLADHQTTGGYTKIATVISADLPVLGRIGPGALVRFEVVDVERAETIARALAKEIASWPERLEPRRPGPAAIQRALLGNNLVSGVVDAMSPAAEEYRLTSR